MTKQDEIRDRLKVLRGVSSYERPYDPDEQYYFVDYHLIADCRWIREGYCDTSRLKTLLANLPYARDLEKDGKRIALFSNLRVTPESELAELRKGSWNEELQKYEVDTITNRIFYFDERYEVSPRYNGGRQPLTKSKDETQKEWEERVETHKLHMELLSKENTRKNYELGERVKSQKANNNGTLSFEYGFTGF